VVSQGRKNRSHIVARGTDFYAQRTLPGGWQHFGGIKNMSDALRQSEALQASGGQHNAVVLAFIQFAQAGIKVAAQRFYL
jgi:hypothetical protein